MSRFSSAIASCEADHDFIIIDTPGGANSLGLFAHSLADTLVTPVNDSFLDLDVIVRSQELTGESLSIPQYSETVRYARHARAGVTRKTTNWLVVRNRVSPLGSKNAGNVLAALNGAAATAGFCVVEGLSERVIFREYFAAGLTAFDVAEVSLLGTKPNSSNVLARLEVRRVLHAIHQLRSGAQHDSLRTRSTNTARTLAKAD